MRWVAAFSLVATAVSVWGCGSSDESEEEEPCVVDKSYAPAIVPADFVASVDNPLFPLPVGRKWTYKDGIETIVVTVLPDKKTILGIECTTVHDVASANGETLEDTLDWYAQDKKGNVWYMGEDTTEYANGKPVTNEGSWEAGVNGAQPGILIEGAPKVGDKYRQEYLACEAEDFGEVLALDASATVPQGSYKGCLKTRDTTPLEPTANEEKTYCPSVGLVLTEDMVTGGREELQTIEGP